MSHFWNQRFAEPGYKYGTAPNAFHPDRLGRISGGPKHIDRLYTLAQLRDDFAGLCDELVGWEGEVLLDEGPGHQGAGCLTRYVGQRSGG